MMRPFPTVLALFALSPLLPAQQRAARAEFPPAVQCAAEEEADAFRRLVLEPEASRRAVTKLQNGLTWHRDLESATGQAAREGRLVLWIRALGDLTGFS